MIDLTSVSFRRDPFPLYAQLRAASPVLQDPGTGLWFLFDHESVNRTLQDHQAFSSAVSGGPHTSRWLLFQDPPRHTRLRALIARAFSPRVIAALEPSIRDLSRELIDRLVERGEADLALDYAIPLPVMVIARMLGAPAEDWKRLGEWSDVVMGLIHTLAPGPKGEEAMNAFARTHQEMGAYVEVLAEERRARPAEDLLSGLLTAEEEGERLSPEDLLAFFQLLLLAGHETTTNLIGSAVLCLLDHPDQLERVRENPALVPGAVEEVLRYRAPVQMMFRMTRHDARIHGRVIPAHSLVLCVIGSANRDEKQIPDAALFDVARHPNPHIAFGHGIHACVGAPLARLEGRIALGDLLTRLRGLTLVADDPWEPREGFHVHGPARLPVRFHAERQEPAGS